MIIGFESANSATPRIVEVNAHENGILLRIFDRDAFLERDKDVARPCHDNVHLRFAQLTREPFRNVEGGIFFGAAKFPVSAVIFSAVTGINNYGAERSARVLRRDFAWAWTSRTCGEKNGRNE